METLTMSQKERKRLTVLAQVKKSHLHLKEASSILTLSYRAVKQVWRRYQDLGDAGLVHRLRGKPSTCLINLSCRRRFWPGPGQHLPLRRQRHHR